MTKKGLEGYCEECANPGIVGEVCLSCGGRIVSMDEDLDKYEEDEFKAARVNNGQSSTPPHDELNLDALPEEEDETTNESLEALTEEELKATDDEEEE